MKAGEKGLIFELMKVAILDAAGKFQGTNVFNKERTKAGAQRFLDSTFFDECCEFVGGNSKVIRAQLESDFDGVVTRLQRKDLCAEAEAVDCEIE